jgi:NAD(P)-dependent dehydrogenase (short-subunit alcohol dehydrogenase family)
MAEKLVLITGCTRGLGLAMTEEFIRLGWKVAGCGRSETAIRALAAKHPAPHQFAVCDVTDAAAVEDFVASVVNTTGVSDLVLNNAAVINVSAPLWEVPAAEFDSVLRVNVTGTFHVLRAITPALIKAGRGVIVNFSSGWGRSTSPEVAPYCASKWAIEGLTQAFAQELPRGLAAVALNPGIIDTEMLRSCFGSGAASCQKPAAWARAVVPWLMQLGPKDNGKALTAPGG